MELNQEAEAKQAQIREIQQSLLTIQQRYEKEAEDAQAAKEANDIAASDLMQETIKRQQKRLAFKEQQKKATVASALKRSGKTLGKDVIEPIVESTNAKLPYPAGISLASGTEHEEVGSILGSTPSQVAEKELLGIESRVFSEGYKEEHDVNPEEISNGQ